MIAYLIGGPQDLVKLAVPDWAPYLHFYHMRAFASETMYGSEHEFRTPASVEGPQRITYKKLYENRTAAQHFAIYVRHNLNDGPRDE